jgi:hypothetical protein
MHPINKLKRAMTEAYLARCPFLAVAAHMEGVDLGIFSPGNDLYQWLRIGRDPNVIGIPDLVFTDAGWSGTLCKKGQLYMVSVPWDAVMQISSEPGKPQPEFVFSWPTDAMIYEDNVRKLRAATPEPKKTGGHLKLV